MWFIVLFTSLTLAIIGFFAGEYIAKQGIKAKKKSWRNKSAAHEAAHALAAWKSHYFTPTKVCFYEYRATTHWQVYPYWWKQMETNTDVTNNVLWGGVVICMAGLVGDIWSKSSSPPEAYRKDFTIALDRLGDLRNARAHEAPFNPSKPPPRYQVDLDDILMSLDIIVGTKTLNDLTVCYWEACELILLNTEQLDKLTNMLKQHPEDIVQRHNISAILNSTLSPPAP